MKTLSRFNNLSLKDNSIRVYTVEGFEHTLDKDDILTITVDSVTITNETTVVIIPAIQIAQITIQRRK